MELPGQSVLGETINLGDLLDGDVTIKLSDAMTSIDWREYAQVRVPLAPLLDAVFTLDGFDLALSHNFTVVESFDSTHGKVPAGLGDAVLIDCHHAEALALSTYQRLLDQVLTSSPYAYLFVAGADKAVREQIK